METVDKERGNTVAHFFRLGLEAEANEQMTIFIDTLAASITEEKLRQNPQISTLLAEMFEAQQKRDILRLADIIEYQLLQEF